MNHSEIAALMKGVAPVIRDLVKAHVAPLERRIEELQQEIEAERNRDVAAEVSRMVADAVAALPPAQPGTSADMDEVARLIDAAVAKAMAGVEPRGPEPDVLRMIVSEEVARIPPAEPGKSVTVEDVAPMLAKLVAEEVGKLPPAQDGESVDIEDVRPLVDDAVAKAVSELPRPADGKSIEPEQVASMVRETVQTVLDGWEKPKDGHSVTTDDVAPMIAEMVEKAVASLPPAEPGEPGAPGKLPLAKAWDGEVTYEAEVRTHKGALWQAVRDTGREPGHEDWICLATAGAPGKDADQIEIAGTFDPGKANAYRRLNIVALNGGAFIAKQDAPGECPGEGWQVIAMRGKSGPPGQSVKGDPGKSIKGDPGEAVVSMSIDSQGMLTLVNGDGSEVECDLYPVLSKIGGR